MNVNIIILLSFSKLLLVIKETGKKMHNSKASFSLALSGFKHPSSGKHMKYLIICYNLQSKTC